MDLLNKSIKQTILDIPCNLPTIKLCAILRYQHQLSINDLKEIKDQWEFVYPPFVNLSELKLKEN